MVVLAFFCITVVRSSYVSCNIKYPRCYENQNARAKGNGQRAMNSNQLSEQELTSKQDPETIDIFKEKTKAKSRPFAKAPFLYRFYTKPHAHFVIEDVRHL